MKRFLLVASAVLLLNGCLAVPQPSDEPPTATPAVEPPPAPAGGELQQIAGVTSVSGDDWPHVTVDTADDLSAVQKELSNHPRWQNGGTLWADGGRVRLTELPDSLTPEGYELIFAASLVFPTAQFWLEAPTTGHGWPQLFVDQVSVEEAPAVAAALDGSVVAAPYDVNYFIRAIGPDGAIDTAGVLGSN